jgi:hypothetical protein
MIDLNTKKDILIVLGKADQEISKITKDYCIYSKDNQFLRHLLASRGYLQDAIISLSDDIIKESKKAMKGGGFKQWKK